MKRMFILFGVILLACALYAFGTYQSTGKVGYYPSTPQQEVQLWCPDACVDVVPLWSNPGEFHGKAVAVVANGMYVDLVRSFRADDGNIWLEVEWCRGACVTGYVPKSRTR